MDAATGTLIGGIVTTVAIYVVHPTIKARLARRQSNDPALGWRSFVDDLQKQVENLTNRVNNLEEEVENLELDNAAKTAAINRLEQTIEDQSNMLLARDARNTQLETLWKAEGRDVPPPDPAFVYWLRNPLDTGGPPNVRNRRSPRSK